MKILWERKTRLGEKKSARRDFRIPHSLNLNCIFSYTCNLLLFSPACGDSSATSQPEYSALPVASYDQASLTYTALPVPAQLTVKPSLIPGAGLGVFATTFISEGVKMGPYEGKRVNMEEVGNFYNTAYAWEVREILYCVLLT